MRGLFFYALIFWPVQRRLIKSYDIGGAVMRVKITLACTECKQRTTTLLKTRRHTGRWEMNKYCRFCRKHTLHKKRSKPDGGTESQRIPRRPSKTPNRLLKLKSRQRRKVGQEREQKRKCICPLFQEHRQVPSRCQNKVKKIVWPTPKSVFKNTGVVLVTIIVVGLVIFGLDTAFMNLLGLIMNIA